MENRSSPVTRLLTVRLTEDEYKQFSMLAKSKHLSMSLLVRLLVQEECERTKVRHQITIK